MLCYFQTYSKVIQFYIYIYIHTIHIYTYVYIHIYNVLVQILLIRGYHKTLNIVLCAVE